MIGLLLPLALAADPPIDAPDLLPLDLPAEGTLRLALPTDVTGLAFSPSNSSLMLHNAAGEDVPFLVYTTELVPASEVTLDVMPKEFHVWQVGPTDMAVEQLRLDFGGDLRHTLDVTVDGLGTTRFATGTVDGEVVTLNTIPVPKGHGPWFVRASAHLLTATGEYRPDSYVQPVCETVLPGDPTYTEESAVRYALTLAGPRWVSSVTLHSEDPAFSRQMWVRASGSARSYSDQQGTIRQLNVDGTHIVQTTLNVLDVHNDSLVVEVSTDHGRVVPVTDFEVCSVASELLVRDPGAGPQTLFVGGVGSEPSSDLASAAPELLQVARRQPVTAVVQPNPAFVPIEEREGVDEAAAALPLVKWHWQRPIVGSGWVRIPLDREVIARAQPSFGDLRIVDTEGHQIPYVVYRTGAETVWDTPPFTRVEEGNSSLIRVALGQDDAPVATVTLMTDRTMFHRRVEILRDRGSVTEQLRSVEWEGAASGVLTLSVNETLGRELLVRIDNGDNPPLAVSAVRVTYPEAELRAHVPEGARLLYGARTIVAPSYDLGLLSDQLVHRRLTEATLGPATETSGPVLGAFERFVVLGAIGSLALAMFLMLGRLLLGSRVPDEPVAAAGAAPPAPSSAPDDAPPKH